MTIWAPLIAAAPPDPEMERLMRSIQKQMEDEGALITRTLHSEPGLTIAEIRMKQLAGTRRIREIDQAARKDAP